MIRIFIGDDHAVVRRGLRDLLSDEFRGAAFAEASDARQSLEQLRKKKSGMSRRSTLRCRGKAAWIFARN
jgi:DNA-binding NarL/FixJ family response regulator